MSDWMTRQEAAAHLGAHVATFDRWRKAVGLPTYKRPYTQRVWFRREDVEAYAEMRETRNG